MELEFDKEIDALMRGRLAGHGKAGETLNAHLDADEISAFAENAMPEKTRALHMAHMAECDRCRRILSRLIVLNSEMAPETAAVAAPAIHEAVTPWYRKLLLFPNLAYVMGGLVLVFGGLLSFTILQNLGGGATSISQIADAPAARGPMAQPEPEYSESSNTVSNASNVAVNINSASAPGVASSDAAANSAPLGTVLEPTETVTEEKMETREVAGISVDGASTGKAGEIAPAAAAPPAKPAAIEQPKDADLARARKEENKLAEAEKSDAATVTVTADDAKKRSVKSKQANEAQLRSQAGGPMKAKPGPSRDSQQNFPNRADNTFEMPITKNVGGRSFTFRNGAWYDSAFRGQPTINVRRSSDEYRKLDRGLRSIAESISGTVVVVWGAKAYRIQ